MSTTPFKQRREFVESIDRLHANFNQGTRRETQMGDLVKLLERLSAAKADFHTIRRELMKASRPPPEPKKLTPEEVMKLKENRRLELISKIEEILKTTLKDIDENKSPAFTLRNQRLWTNCVLDENERIVLKEMSESKPLVVDYAAKRSKNKFDLIMHLLARIYDMLENKTYRTRRELYYQSFTKVKDQRAIDRAIGTICCLLDAPQWELGIMASSKGLIAGPLEITTKEGQVISCMNERGGILIPQDVFGIISVKSDAKYILVIEKDATFQKMIDDGALERLRPCILITGKGYPDINTRLMLKFLVDSLSIPALALVDADPHGIDIMCVYRYGSLGMSHAADSMAVPSLLWLGILPSDIVPLAAPRLPLTPRDVSKCHELLARPYCAASASRLRAEVELMLRENAKTELEGVDTMSRAHLTDAYVVRKMCAERYI